MLNNNDLTFITELVASAETLSTGDLQAIVEAKYNDLNKQDEILQAFYKKLNEEDRQ